MEDFEALGRYVAASEKAAEFRIERNKCAQAIVTATSRILGGTCSTYFAATFDAAKIQELLDKAAGAEQNMRTAIIEANIHAEACNRPKLKLHSLN